MSPEPFPIFMQANLICRKKNRFLAKIRCALQGAAYFEGDAVKGDFVPLHIYYAISRAISIILLKVFWRSSAGRASPVTRLSEMVSSASAFFPAAAAFRYSA